VAIAAAGEKAGGRGAMCFMLLLFPVNTVVIYFKIIIANKACHKHMF